MIYLHETRSRFFATVYTEEGIGTSDAKQSSKRKKKKKEEDP